MPPTSLVNQSGSSNRSKLLSLAIAILCCVAPLTAQTPAFVSFDAQGAGTKNNQGTIGYCINQSGTIGGFYYDANNVAHAFVRSVSGTIIEFDPPGLVGNFVNGINAGGQIIGVGSYDSNQGSIFVGFLRNPSGTLIHIAPPGAMGSSLGSSPNGINDSGEIAGEFADSEGLRHGYVRDPGGNYTTFDEPDAFNQPGYGTHVTGINANGEVTGEYDDTAGVLHGYIRDQFGSFTSFDPPGSGVTIVTAINLSGEVAGYYGISPTALVHGFLRDAAGNVTSFDPAHSEGTFALGMNDAGTVVGEWNVSPTLTRGFQRTASGSIISFSASPPASTAALAINNAGHMTGFYLSSIGPYHGFVQ